MATVEPLPTPLPPSPGDIDLDALRRAVEQRGGLPNEAYVSPAFHRLEQERLFRRTWVLAGYRHEFAAPGDVRPVMVAGVPLLLAHGHDGRIRAFHNVCRHRGAELLTAPCSGARLLTCPNHSWSYDLAGRLKARPHFDGGDRHDRQPAEPERDGLVPVRCETFFDWVFVNVSGDAAPLDRFLAPLTSALADYDLGALRFGGRLDFSIAANWKLPYENFIEPYHVFSAHPWLHGFVPMNRRVAPTFDGHVLACGYEFEKPDPARGGQLPHFPGLPPAKQRRGDWWVVFPSLAVEVFPDQLDLFVVRPTGPETCVEEILVYFVGEGATAPAYATARRHVLDNWNTLNAEDLGLIERMQRGRHSPGFDGGVLSPFWDGYVGHLSRLVLDAVSAPT